MVKTSQPNGNEINDYQNMSISVNELYSDLESNKRSGRYSFESQRKSAGETEK